MRIDCGELVAQIERGPENTIGLRVSTLVAYVARLGTIVGHGHVVLIEIVDIVAKVALGIVETRSCIAILTCRWWPP